MNRLHTITDELNGLLRCAEEMLRQLNYGVEAGIGLGDDTELVFRKVENAWGLHVRLPNGQTVPVLSSSRQNRVRAAIAIPALQDRMRVVVEEQTEHVQDAIVRLRAYLDTTSKP